jgi:ribosome-associated protein
MRTKLAPGVWIDDSELIYTFSRSQGPGGQNVQKVSTKVTLRFNVRQNPSLADAQKARISAVLGHRLTREGVLAVTVQTHRTQAANRRAALARLQQLITAALAPRRVRKPTRPTRAAKERRLQAKRQRGQQRRQRSWRASRDDTSS